MKTKPIIINPNPKTEFETPERCRILEVWNDIKDENVSIARARVKPGITTQLHKLKGINEKYVIINGKGTVTIGDLEPAEVNVDDVVIIPSDTPQMIKNTGSEDLLFYCICTPRFIEKSYQTLE